MLGAELLKSLVNLLIDRRNSGSTRRLDWRRRLADGSQTFATLAGSIVRAVAAPEGCWRQKWMPQGATCCAGAECARVRWRAPRSLRKTCDTPPADSLSLSGLGPAGLRPAARFKSISPADSRAAREIFASNDAPCQSKHHFLVRRWLSTGSHLLPGSHQRDLDASSVGARNMLAPTEGWLAGPAPAGSCTPAGLMMIICLLLKCERPLSSDGVIFTVAARVVSVWFRSVRSS